MTSPGLALLAFFLSGFAALLYQVIWQRLLVFFSGADVHSVTLIVAAFMAGLGVGNLAGGHIADRLGARQNLWMFVAAELAIGGFGLISRQFYYDVLYQRLASWSAAPAADAVLFISLLWPTFFMGVSLPLLARGLTRLLSEAGRTVGSLYGFNTLGAAVGAFATTWLLLPRLGLSSTLPLGAAMNFACAAIGVFIALRVPASGSRPAPLSPELTTASAAQAGLSFRSWAAVYAVTGFAALSLEIVWFRVLGVVLKSTAFTFGTLLTVYLAGLGAGAAVGAAVVRRSHRPGQIFLALQLAVVILSGAGVLAFVETVDNGSPPALLTHLLQDDYSVAPAMRALSGWLSGAGSGSDPSALRHFLGVYGLLPLLLLGGPTLLMGFSFPFLQQAVQADPDRLGRRVGLLMTANIAGSALGAIITGLALLPGIGTAATLKGIVLLGAVPGLLWATYARAVVGRLVRAAGVSVTLAALVVALPDGPRLWAALHGVEPRQMIAEEDGAGITVLRAGSEGFERRVRVFVNGLSQSWIPFGNIHTVLGALPIVLHPNPHEIAIIGLGSGDTAFSAGGRRETAEIVCIEIIGGQLAALERLRTIYPDPGLVSLLSDSRVRHVVDDGRAFLLQSERRYDVIEADALRPSTAYSGNLYSREYFALMRSRLKTGGLAVTWVPTDRVARTFLSVFPHVVALRDVYVGSNEPIALDWPAIDRRRRAPEFVRYYAAAGINIDALLTEYFGSDHRVFGPDTARPAAADLNTDLFPRDELTLIGR